MPLIATVPLTASIVGARAELLRKGQNTGPLLSQGLRFSVTSKCRPDDAMNLDFDTSKRSGWREDMCVIVWRASAHALATQMSHTIPPLSAPVLRSARNSVCPHLFASHKNRPNLTVQG